MKPAPKPSPAWINYLIAGCYGLALGAMAGYFV